MYAKIWRYQFDQKKSDVRIIFFRFGRLQTLLLKKSYCAQSGLFSYVLSHIPTYDDEQNNEILFPVCVSTTTRKYEHYTNTLLEVLNTLFFLTALECLKYIECQFSIPSVTPHPYCTTAHHLNFLMSMICRINICNELYHFSII